jgi:uncharacterized protein Yka (UPF0111/DUF47 family)
MTHWFLPPEADLAGRLREQAALAVESAAAFEEWAGGDADGGERVRDIEKRADHVKRQLFRELRETFAPPIDGEDIFVIGEGLEDIINQIKNTVRESDVLELPPDDGVRELVATLRHGIEALGRAVDCLTGDHQGATDAADEVIKSNHQLEHIYRNVMSESLIEGDLREVLAKRELYRRLSRLGDAISHIAERVWYAIVKEG